MGDLAIGEWAQIVTMLGIVFMIARGIVTKKDCEKCKTAIDEDLDSGSDEFKDVRQTLSDHGEQIAGISSTVNGMATNVETLVARAMGN